MSYGQYSDRGGFSRARGGKRYSNDQVVHVWAAQSVEDGSNGKGSIYFRGPTIFSYGEHFPMAHYMPCGDVVLLNSTSSSVTTNGHKYSVARAVSHKRTIMVPALDKLLDIGGPIRLISQALTPQAVKAGKAGLLAYLMAQAPDMGREAVDYLAALIGREGETIARKAVAARAKAKAQEAKRERDQAITQGKRWAEMSAAEFSARVEKMSREYSPEATLTSFAKQLRLLHKAASDTTDRKVAA